jgi:dGTP triphosphohydrolase
MQRHCAGDRRVQVSSHPEGSDIARRLVDYAAGYADRQAERARD